MKKYLLALVILVGMLGYVILGAFNPYIFFPLGLIALGIAFWAINTLAGNDKDGKNGTVKR